MNLFSDAFFILIILSLRTKLQKIWWWYIQLNTNTSWKYCEMSTYLKWKGLWVEISVTKSFRKNRSICVLLYTDQVALACWNYVVSMVLQERIIFPEHLNCNFLGSNTVPLDPWIISMYERVILELDEDIWYKLLLKNRERIQHI